MPIIYALNGYLNKEFWLRQFVKNGEILWHVCFRLWIETVFADLDSEYYKVKITRDRHVIVWLLWDYYHSFKMVQKVFGGVFKKENVFKKTEKSFSVILPW